MIEHRLCVRQKKAERLRRGEEHPNKAVGVRVYFDCDAVREVES